MTVQIIDVHPEEDVPSDHVFAYRFLPNFNAKRYRQRTDRNIGWITPDEQFMLLNAIVGIAGCGGMGGLIASTLNRLGIGEIRIADNEVFDETNINRQFAAMLATVGKSKALETARMIRAICDDTTLMVYPQGINERTVRQFVAECDVICDEIEFWAVGSRILLHKTARAFGVPVFNCNTVGFGSRLFLFEPDGYTIEELLGLQYAEAMELQERIQSGTATHAETEKLMRAVLKGLVPELPEYSSRPSEYSTVGAAQRRLLEENRAPIIATNPPMASGFLADHVLLYLCRESTILRDVVRLPPPPGYLYLDVAHLQAKVVERSMVSHGT